MDKEWDMVKCVKTLSRRNWSNSVIHFLWRVLVKLIKFLFFYCLYSSAYYKHISLLQSAKGILDLSSKNKNHVNIKYSCVDFSLDELKNWSTLEGSRAFPHDLF